MILKVKQKVMQTLGFKAMTVMGSVNIAAM